MPRDLRGGFSLLELMVAIALLGTAGTGLVALVGQTRATMDQALAAELRVRRASRTLHELARESRVRLEQRVGRRRVGAYDVRVTYATQDLVAIALADTGTGVVFVETVVYRPRRGVDAQ